MYDNSSSISYATTWWDFNSSSDQYNSDKSQLIWYSAMLSVMSQLI